MARLTEKDVRHDAEPERFGDAMLACQGFPPYCLYSGKCSHGGDCFRTDPQFRVMAARLIRQLSHKHEGVTAALIAAAARAVNDGTVQVHVEASPS